MIKKTINCFSSRERMELKFGLLAAEFILLVLVMGDAVSKNVRKKRYITFPKGSTLSVQICLTYQMGITPGYIFTEAVNWGINYPLEKKEEMMTTPDTSEETAVRREKRSLLGKLEKMFYHMGYHGRDCILRSLCEFSSIFKNADKTIERELLKIFFEYTSEWPIEYETKEDEIYHRAQMTGQNGDPRSCYEAYPKCHFSLINVLIGKHSIENMLEYMRK
ncbi:uncharacterized protein LOC123316890 [Coccinella septempunctata]|uniref:uncharacterized protein LOC123316890 n=1 Tax=Coccinella septempunctata TaxID=41139 RepID=UPI001D08F7A7|nr:uncharacterized protein LOC123316890 [Coccinella septempunctata]